MKAFQRIVFIVCIVTFCRSTQPVKAEFDFDYFGQEPPGMEAKHFNPRIEGIEGAELESLHFTPDGNECYFIMKTNDVREVFLREKKDGLWTVPRPAPFPDGATSIHGFSPDGNRLYFPTQPSDNFEQSGVYVRTRTTDGWSLGERLPEPVNLDHANRVIGMTVGAYEDLYFCTWRQPCLGACDVWRAKNANGTFPVTENLRVLNTPTSECMIICGPNDSVLVFYSWRPGGFGQADLYFSVQTETDTWAVPKNLGPRVNTYQGEVPQTFSPDYKHMFFHRYSGANGGLYWIETKAVLPLPEGPIVNLNSGLQFGSLQCAIDYANTGDEIVIAPGTYKENIDLKNKDIVIRSSNPNNPAITAATILQGDSIAPIVTLNGNSSLKGLSIIGGSIGIVCEGTSQSILSCQIIKNRNDGIQVSKETHLDINNSIIATNKGTGIRMLTNTIGRIPTYGNSTITNCTITQNREPGIIGGDSTITNSIVYFNGADSDIPQIEPHSTVVTYSCIQNTWQGQVNIDTDPCFAQIGYWLDINDPNSEWIQGDYHLTEDSPCIDAGNPASPVGLEPIPNGGIINMGLYGGTIEAVTTNDETL